jgi:uncharacterized protein YbjT (DUF2867 family)
VSSSIRVVIAGGHGQIARQLAVLLTARDDVAISLIRNPEHAAELSGLGAEPVVLDLETASAARVAEVLVDSDVVIFAAGAGPGSSLERKDTVDRGGSVLLADAAEIAGVRRFLQVSSFGAGEAVPPGTDPVFAAYLMAKTAAEDDLIPRRNLGWTILRPGGLTDDPGTGLVRLAEPPLGSGSVPRADVAAVLLALIDAPSTAGKILMLTQGPDPIQAAVAAI